PYTNNARCIPNRRGKFALNDPLYTRAVAKAFTPKQPPFLAQLGAHHPLSGYGRESTQDHDIRFGKVWQAPVYAQGHPKAWHDSLKGPQRLLRPRRIRRCRLHVANLQIDIFSRSKRPKQIALVR